MREVIGQMSETLVHRGPDDRGSWTDEDAGVALGHTRLSVIDLSPTGHQPMVSSSGRHVLVFNGEIYNFRTLRDRLESQGARFRGSSDTEVLLAALSRWGVRATLKALNGMFAFGLWDRRKRVLTLARDRLGEKPLYYGVSDGAFLFCSELKALHQHPSFDGKIDRHSLSLFFQFGYVPAPHSIFQDIVKLEPGHYVQIPWAESYRTLPEPVCYWSLIDVVTEAQREPLEVSVGEMLAELDHLLRESVGIRMEADVPLGAFLSGGIDSSLVVAAMQAQSSRPVRTFTIGFEHREFDEATHARAVATHLGTEHTECYVSSADARAVIPRLPELYDEPFADPSQIPTFLVSELARETVTVALSGDGGDELFGGYNRHFWSQRLWSYLEKTPDFLKPVAGAALGKPTVHQWNMLYRGMERFLPDRLHVRSPGRKLQKLASSLSAKSPDELYVKLVSHVEDGSQLVKGRSSSRENGWAPPTEGSVLPDIAEQMMYADSVQYLPDDILVKTDRASMGVGLEVRVPFLDPRLVEFAWRVPMTRKIRENRGKWLTRMLLQEYVPAEVVNRPKSGFYLPIGSWLRGPLREWAESLLSRQRIQDEGFLEAEVIRRRWDQHVFGSENRESFLWDVLMFQAWLERWH